jgi:hypothetical protein
MNFEQFKNEFYTHRYKLIVYNNCYGGGPPRLNKEAKAFYDSLQTNDTNEKLLLTIEKFGVTATTEFTQEFGLCLCPIEYENCYDIDEYDGLETPVINHDKVLKMLIYEHFFENHNVITKEEYERLNVKSKDDIPLIFFKN